MFHLPDLPYTIKGILIIASGVLLLRLSGKRSIAQLTVPESVLMIAVGTILIQPLGVKSEWRAIYGGALLIAGMIVLSYAQIYIPFIRRFVYGVPSVLIRDGQIDLKEMKKCKMTEDQLKMRLRLEKIGTINDIKIGILEPSGQLSFVPREEKKEAEKMDIQALANQIQALEQKLMMALGQQPTTPQTPYITKPVPMPLFHEAAKEDYIDHNMTTH